MRLLSFIFNPIAYVVRGLVFALARAIDRRLGPRLGLGLAFLFIGLSVAVFAGSLYGLRHEMGKLAGLETRPAVEEVAGTVVEERTVKKKVSEREQRIVAEIGAGEGRRQVTDVLKRSTGSEYAIGDAITVYRLADGRLFLENPEDPWRDGFLVAVMLGVNALFVFYVALYRRHRLAFVAEYREQLARVPVDARGATPIPTTAERLDLDRRRVNGHS